MSKQKQIGAESKSFFAGFEVKHTCQVCEKEFVKKADADNDEMCNDCVAEYINYEGGPSAKKFTMEQKAAQNKYYASKEAPNV